MGERKNRSVARKTTQESREEAEPIIQSSKASVLMIKKEIKKDLEEYSKTGDISRRIQCRIKPQP